MDRSGDVRSAKLRCGPCVNYDRALVLQPQDFRGRQCRQCGQLR